MAVSVYISNEQLHVLIGSGSSGKARIRRVYCLPLSEGLVMNGVITDEIRLREELQRIWKQYRLPRKKIYLVIDSGKIMTKVLEVPYMKDRELLRHISQEFADGEREEQVLDYFPLSRKSPYDLNRIFCASIEKSVIDSYLSLFGEAKLKISRVNIGLGCLIKAVMVSGFFKGKTGMFMLIEGSNVISVLFEDGLYIYSRRNRLFNDPGTPEWIEELELIAGGIRQFHTQRHSGYRLDTIYMVGCEENVIQEISNRSQDYGIHAEAPGALDRIRFPGTGICDTGAAEIKPAAYIYSIGNLLE